MQHKKISTGLSVIVVLALLLAALVPTTAIFASDPEIDLDPDSDEPGSSVTITGTDFTEDYYYYIYFDEEYTDISGEIDDEGEFEETYDIDDDLNEDDYVITVLAFEDEVDDPDYDDDYDNADETAEATFEVTEDDSDPEIEVDPESAEAGDTITISGSGFTEDYRYYIFFDEDYISKYGTIDEDGEFTKTYTIPSSTDDGEYEIAVMAVEDSNSSPDYDDDYADADETAEATVEVSSEDAVLNIDVEEGHVGDTFILSGSAFGKTKTMSVYWDSTKYSTTFTSTSSGTFSGKEYTVPETYAGSHTIKVVDSAGTSQTVSYTVTPSITISSTSVSSGNSITVIGTGFKASTTVSFYVDSTSLNAVANTTAKGSFSSTSVTVTSTASGSHVIKVQDSSGYSATSSVNISVPTPTKTATPTQAAPVQTTTAPTANQVPAQQSTSAPTSNVVQNQTAPNNQQAGAPGAQQQPSQTSSSSSGFPTWAIFVIIAIVVIIVILVVVLVMSRRKV